MAARYPDQGAFDIDEQRCEVGYKRRSLGDATGQA